MFTSIVSERGGSSYLAKSPDAAHASVLERDRRAGRFALLLFGGLGVALLAAGGSTAETIEVLYPTLALICGILLYRHYPITYVSYTWWLVFITPEVRRLVDYQSGWSFISPVMVTVWLVAGLPAFSFVCSRERWRDRQLLPFWLILGGLALGYVVGLLRAHPMAATYSLLIWAAPVFFGMYIVQLGSKDFPALRRVLQRTFLWGTLLLGIYGIWQFFMLPGWDRYWMIQSELLTAGYPEPRKVRVFSTLNSPNPFAVVMMTGLLLLFVSRNRLRYLAAAAGYTAFMLSLVRGAWIGWGISVLILTAFAPHAQRRWLILALLGVGLSAGWLAYHSPLQDAIGDRFNTLGDVLSGDDYSLNERLQTLEQAQDLVYAAPLGKGLGSAGTTLKLSGAGGQVYDNGFFQTLFELGWIGALAYGIGVAWLLLKGLQNSRRGSDMFTIVAFAIAVSLLVQMFVDHTFNDTAGMAAWTFISVAAIHARPRVLSAKNPDPWQQSA